METWLARTIFDWNTTALSLSEWRQQQHPIGNLRRARYEESIAANPERETENRGRGNQWHIQEHRTPLFVFIGIIQSMSSAINPLWNIMTDYWYHLERERRSGRSYSNSLCLAARFVIACTVVAIR